MKTAVRPSFTESTWLIINASVPFNAVFLAAGATNTTRIFWSSRQLYDRTVVLKESQKFVLPLLRLQGAETTISHPSITLASVFLETKVPKLSERCMDAQIDPFNQLVLDGSPIPGKSTRLRRRVRSPLLRRLLVVRCSMHSDDSCLELTLRPHNGEGRDPLEFNLCPTAEAKAAARTAANALLEKALRFETIFVSPMIKTANPGSDTH